MHNQANVGLVSTEREREREREREKGGGGGDSISSDRKSAGLADLPEESPDLQMTPPAVRCQTVHLAP